MTQYKRIGIDTSKAVFTLHGIDQHDRPLLRINLRRVQMIPFLKKLPPTVIALEACGTSHHWGREVTALGHMVRLVPPQYVKPYVKRGTPRSPRRASLRRNSVQKVSASEGPMSMPRSRP